MINFVCCKINIPNVSHKSAYLHEEHLRSSSKDEDAASQTLETLVKCRKRVHKEAHFVQRVGVLGYPVWTTYKHRK